MTNEQKNDLRNYIKENVENFTLRYDLALSKIDHYRCSLKYADIDLYTDIDKSAFEWVEENEDVFEPDEIFEF